MFFLYQKKNPLLLLEEVTVLGKKFRLCLLFLFNFQGFFVVDFTTGLYCATLSCFASNEFLVNSNMNVRDWKKKQLDSTPVCPFLCCTSLTQSLQVVPISLDIANVDWGTKFLRFKSFLKQNLVQANKSGKESFLSYMQSIIFREFNYYFQKLFKMAKSSIMIGLPNFWVWSEKIPHQISFLLMMTFVMCPLHQVICFNKILQQSNSKISKAKTKK